MSAPRSVPLTLTMTWRAWQQQGAGIALLAVAAGVMLGAGTLLLQGGVNGLPADLPASILTLAQVTQRGEVVQVNTFMVAFSPVLLALLCALLATIITPSVVSEDLRGGLLEVLLSTPLTKAQIFSAYLGAALLLTGLCWGLCSLALLLTWAALTHLLPLGLGLSLSPTLAWILAALPLSMTLWSAAVMLGGALLYPRTLDSSAGVNGSPARLLALAPSLLLMPAMVLASQHLGPLLLGGLVGLAALSLAVFRVTERRFRTAALLQ